MRRIGGKLPIPARARLAQSQFTSITPTPTSPRTTTPGSGTTNCTTRKPMPAEAAISSRSGSAAKVLAFSSR